MQPEVRVHLDLGRVVLAFEGSQSFFDRVVEPLVDAASPGGDGATRVGAVASGEAGANLAARPEPTGFRPRSSHFSKYLKQVGARAETPDKQVMAFGFFLWNYERIEAFGTEELSGCFQTVGLEVPDDLEAILAVLRDKKRFLTDADPEAGSFALTPKGRNYVKNRLLSA